MSRILKLFKRPPRDPFNDDAGEPPTPIEYWWMCKVANWETNREIKEDRRRLERSQSISVPATHRGSKIVKKQS